MTDEERFVTAADEDFADSDFAAIESAVMETSRGRWFLKEYARRNRHADTECVLEAISRLSEDTLPGRAVRVMDHLHDNLQSLATALTGVRQDAAQLPPADRVGLHPAHPDVPLNDADRVGVQQISRMIRNLRHMEARLQAMIAVCAPETPANEPMRSTEPTAAHPPFLM